jgi:flavin reductase (DIM6/NTAB) family NADH-FMN oxidoreductase RutF
VLPRPIAWVSTISAAGTFNLAPFSFFNVVCANPPTVVFCPMLGRTGQPKDTISNLRVVPEFVIQVASRQLAEKMNLCSGEFAAEVDEFEVAGLTPVPSRKVSVPRVGEAQAIMECRLREIITIGEGPGSGSLVLGEVVLFEVEDSLLVEGEVQIDGLAPIGRLAGADYCTVTDRFALQRPLPDDLGVPGRS